MDSYRLLGVEVNPLSIPELNTLIQVQEATPRPYIIANHNLYSVYLYHHDAQMRDFYALSDVTHIDGMPLVIWGKYMGYPFERPHRVTYVDWLWPLMAAADNHQWDIFYLGARPGVGQRAIEVIQHRHPTLRMGSAHGYFDMTPDSPENKTRLEQIHNFAPTILMVGMGMPRQEHWITQNIDALPPCIILTSGACFDYVAGMIPTPPRWMGQVSLEWFYRLLAEPRRLFRRYLIQPWRLTPWFIRDIKRKLRE